MPSAQPLTPLYTPTNCRAAFQLNWSVATFWISHAPAPDLWLAQLQNDTEPDGVRILEHSIRSPSTSQFLVSTKPAVSPSQMIRSIKGRLQYLVRREHPKAFHRNYAFRSVGSVKQGIVDKYIASQVQHYDLADPNVVQLLERVRFHDPSLDLTVPAFSTYGKYWYTLHLVLCNAGRYREIDERTLRGIRDQVIAVAKKHKYHLSRCAILPDHLHMEVSARPDVSPEELALRFMNNISYVFGMHPVLEFSYYVGTLGEYDRAVCRE